MVQSTISAHYESEGQQSQHKFRENNWQLSNRLNPASNFASSSPKRQSFAFHKFFLILAWNLSLPGHKVQFTNTQVESLHVSFNLSHMLKQKNVSYIIFLKILTQVHVKDNFSSRPNYFYKQWRSYYSGCLSTWKRHFKKTGLSHKWIEIWLVVFSQIASWSSVFDTPGTHEEKNVPNYTVVWVSSAIKTHEIIWIESFSHLLFFPQYILNNQ